MAGLGGLPVGGRMVVNTGLGVIPVGGEIPVLGAAEVGIGGDSSGLVAYLPEAHTGATLPLGSGQRGSRSLERWRCSDAAIGRRLRRRKVVH